MKRVLNPLCIVSFLRKESFLWTRNIVPLRKSEQASFVRFYTLTPDTEKPGDSRAIPTNISKQFSTGFTDQQAEILTSVMRELTQSTMENATKAMVTKPQQEIMVQQLLAQIATVKKDMVILEKSEFTMIRNDTEKQGSRIKQLEESFQDEVKKLAGQIKLDINLEKSRAIEAHAINEKNLQLLLNKLDVEHAQNEKNLKTLENKVDVELSNMRTSIEKNRSDAMRYNIGLTVAMISAVFGMLRYFGS